MNKWVWLLLIFCINPLNNYSEDSVEIWNQQLEKYGLIYAHIKRLYPQKTDAELIVSESIKGFLNSLDPHSYFMDRTDFRSLNEDQQGNYHGIGLRLAKYNNSLTVIELIKETPACKAGILPGDIILEIDDRKAADFSTDDAMKLLRGSKDSTVCLKISRKGCNQELIFDLKREEIPLHSVLYALVHPKQNKIGYINLRVFGNTTNHELSSHISKLIDHHGISALILDLRGNSGGSLFAATKVADLFLEKGKPIVSVKGRSFNQSFVAEEDNQFENLPLAILINRGSASASEIVAAALQFHKKAVIIGSRSWGKGLVESVRDLSLNTALALTTAKYYTPDNQCIQRDYQNIDDYLFFINQSELEYDFNKAIIGGVIPDIVQAETAYPMQIYELINQGVFFEFAHEIIHSTNPFPNVFKFNRRLFKKFKKFLVSRQIYIDSKLLLSFFSHIGYEIEKEVMNLKYSSDEGIMIFLKNDPLSLRAIKYWKSKKMAS
jgi:carboxyl-terminal processing protease